MPSVASEINASQHLRTQPSQARSRADACDPGQNSSFTDLLDSATGAPEPTVAPTNGQTGKPVGGGAADTSAKTEAAKAPDTSKRLQDLVPGMGEIEVAQGANGDADMTDAKAALDPEGKAPKADGEIAAVDTGTTKVATDPDSESGADVGLAVAPPPILIDPAQQPVAAGLAVGAAPQPLVADATPADAAAPSAQAPSVDAPAALQAATPAPSPVNAGPAEQDDADADGNAQAEDTDGVAGTSKTTKAASADTGIKPLTQAKSEIVADADTGPPLKSDQNGEASQQNGKPIADLNPASGATPASTEAKPRSSRAPQANADARTVTSADAATAEIKSDAATDDKAGPKDDVQTDARADVKLDAKSDAKTEIRTAPVQNPNANFPTAASASAIASALAATPAQTLTHTPPPALAAAHIQAQLQANADSGAAVPLSGVAVEITSQVLAGNQHFEIRLDPPDLGRIDVKLDIDADGNTTTRLVVERSDTLDLLKRDANQLERALQQAGLKTSDNALEFSLRQQFAQTDDQRQPNTTTIVVPDQDAAPMPVQRQSYGRLLGLSGGLDIRV